ncbi:MAG: AAA family ATPase, partial [Planctomycetales bacterium]|nr:AAA family ATPase [Planctomycetales bacterium]
MGLFDLFKKAPAPAPEKAEPAPTASKREAEGPVGFFDGLKRALRKTADILNTDVRDLFKKEGRLVDDQFLTEFFAILVKTDMGVGPAARIRDKIGTDFRARVVHMQDVLAVVKTELRELLVQPEKPVHLAASGPTVILVVGVNGSGKTTSIAKLTQHFRGQDMKVVLGAADTFRAAAVDQLTIWADRLGAEIEKGPPGGDPASVAHQAVARALETGADICIVDTAGRL